MSSSHLHPPRKSSLLLGGGKGSGRGVTGGGKSGSGSGFRGSLRSSLSRGRAISHGGTHAYRLKLGGSLRFVQFEAQAIANSSVPAHNAHALATLIFERREALAAAYAAAENTEATGIISVSSWVGETQRVLGLRVPLRRVFAYVLDEQRSAGVAEQRIDHAAFLARFALRCPDLTPLYSMRHCLLALLAEKEDGGSSGTVAMSDFEACCRTLHAHDAAAAELCEPPSRLLAACGAASKDWVEEGSVSVVEFEGCFTITELC